MIYFYHYKVYPRCDSLEYGQEGSKPRGPWLAQLMEHATLHLRVVGLSPRLGVETNLKNKILTKKKKEKKRVVARVAQ